MTFCGSGALIMKPEQIIEEINGLELSEKLMLVEDIWDSIATDNLEIPMPKWQKIKLDERYKEYEEGKLKLHDWEEVHKNLRESVMRL